MNNEEFQFVLRHLGDNPEELLLSARRYPGIDVPACVDQIVARRQLRYKVPEWYACSRLLMSGRVPAEQCSSEITARMKRRFVWGDSLCDLTGGMGVDLWYLSQGRKKAVYVERNPELFAHTRHNIETLLDLGETGTSLLPNDPFCPEWCFVNRDCRDFLDEDWQADTIYIDPARRAASGSRVYDLKDCEPDVTELLPRLLSRARVVTVKVSPMFDIARAASLFAVTPRVGVTAVHNECRELLLAFDPEGLLPPGPQTVCMDYIDGEMRSFAFDRSEETSGEVSYAAPMDYLYVPDVTLFKAGAFRTPCVRYGLSKLDVNTHLYTSDRLENGFFGRVFRIEETLPFSSRAARDIRKQAPAANVAVRNFPLTAPELQHKLGIRDGGDSYLFGATVRGMGSVLMWCRKVLQVVVMLLALCLPTDLWARRTEPVPTVEELCRAVTNPAPVLWQQGKLFVSTVSDIDVVLHPETSLSDTTRRDWKGTFWRFEAIVTEENWLGQPQVWLQFLSPSGERWRYETGRGEAVLADTAWHPRIPGLLPLSTVTLTDSLLRGRTFYLRTDDERILPSDSLSQEAPSRKYCPVRVDSVTFGTDQTPLRVWFTRDTLRYSFFSALPGSDTAPGLDRFLLSADPRPDYPDISDRRWEMICRRMLEADMTSEEVRLSWGRPYRYERTVTTAGPTEVWYYRNGTRLLIVNGRLQSHGI